MILLLALIPWVLTVGALLFIIIRNRYIMDDEEYYDEDESEDPHDVSVSAAAIATAEKIPNCFFNVIS